MEHAPDATPSYRHVIRLSVVLALLIGAALTARWFFVPKGFGTYGHYRAAAVVDARKRQPRHASQAKCLTCHDDVGKLHAKDAHARVNCETCHSVGWKHVENPSKKNIAADRSRALCLTCHQQLDARPAAFPQIEVAEHFKLVGVQDPNLACIKCHSPHEPLFMDRDLTKARLHPLVQRCRDCHTDRRDPSTPKPATHPPIFECGYCHSAKVKDFATRKHKKLRCSTCHIFRKETEFAGRIVRDADPRFCLLCHRKTPFRGKGSPPGIDPKVHLKDAPGASCLECHRDALHGEPPEPPARPAPRPTEEPAKGDGMAPAEPAMAAAGERPAPPAGAMAPAGMGPVSTPPPTMAAPPAMAPTSRPGGMTDAK